MAPASLLSALSLQRCPSLSSLLTHPAISGMWTPARLAPCGPGKKGGPPPGMPSSCGTPLPHGHAPPLWNIPSPKGTPFPKLDPSPLGVALPQGCLFPQRLLLPLPHRQPPQLWADPRGISRGGCPCNGQAFDPGRSAGLTRGHQETLSLSGAPSRPLVPPQPCCLLEVVACLRLLSGPCVG